MKGRLITIGLVAARHSKSRSESPAPSVTRSGGRLSWCIQVRSVDFTLQF